MTTLTIDQLKSQGAFTTGAPVEKTVTWKQGEQEYSATVFVRPLSYRTAVSDIATLHSKGDATAGRIASSIVDAEGKPVFTAADITGEADPERGPLCYELTMELLRVIAEVSQVGKPPAS